MNRSEITTFLQAILEEELKKLKKKKEPYVEDADSDDDKEEDDDDDDDDDDDSESDKKDIEEEDKDKKKMRQDKGAYKSLASTGVKDSTIAEEQLDESMNSFKKKMFKLWFGKSVQEIIRNAQKLSDDDLKLLFTTPEDAKTLPASAYGVQMKAIGKEMKRRGLLNEEVIEEAIDPTIKKHIDMMKKKGKNEIEILMDIDKKHPKLSKKELEAIADHLSG